MSSNEQNLASPAQAASAGGASASQAPAAAAAPVPAAPAAEAASKAPAAPASKAPAPAPAQKKPAAPARPPAAKPLNKKPVSDEVVIRFDHVTKTYHLYKNDRARLLGMLGIKRKGACAGVVNASDDLTFEVRKGEAIAFIGHNGAGKSTLLKMITGVTSPTSGTVSVEGSVSALLELTAGFDMKLTGRENIDLRCQIMGFSKEKMKELEPAVIEFADLGVYIDQPMRSYSSGMKARLGFAFAVAVKPDILIVDEALSVGDVMFRRKCIKRIREIMMDENVTVLFVTHSNATAKEFCSRGIVLDHGKMLFDGKLDDAIAFYADLTKDAR